MTDFNYRILVVDDDANIRTVSQAMLAGRGYDTRIAGNGFEALAMMRNALPDLIICDLAMPQMSGFEFLSIVRRRFPQIAVIATSGDFAGPNVPTWVLADAFIPKADATPELMLQRVAELLEASPLRAQMPKPDKAPVWIPRNGNYIVLTCPECLRSSSLPADEAEAHNGVAEQECISCSTRFRYFLERRQSE